MSPTAAPALDLRDVSIGRGGRTILAGVNARVQPGEFIGVFGPNGAGKSTLFAALLGLLPLLGGEIRVLGEGVTRGNPAIGFMPQARAQTLDVRLSGLDFVGSAYRGHRFGLPLLGRAGREAVAEALSTVGATELARRPLGSLSGGERQRLLLAQALLGHPRLLLLDEPLISLDPRYQRAVIDLVRQVQRERGLTVLMSAHELNPLLGSMDRVLYLGAGRAALGEVDEVITGPVLSGLYGAEIEVIRHRGRIFVVNGPMNTGGEVDHDAHRHDALV